MELSCVTTGCGWIDGAWFLRLGHKTLVASALSSGATMFCGHNTCPWSCQWGTLCIHKLLWHGNERGMNPTWGWEVEAISVKILFEFRFSCVQTLEMKQKRSLVSSPNWEVRRGAACPGRQRRSGWLAALLFQTGSSEFRLTFPVLEKWNVWWNGIKSFMHCVN